MIQGGKIFMPWKIRIVTRYNLESSWGFQAIWKILVMEHEGFFCFGILHLFPNKKPRIIFSRPLSYSIYKVLLPTSNSQKHLDGNFLTRFRFPLNSPSTKRKQFPQILGTGYTKNIYKEYICMYSIVQCIYIYKYYVHIKYSIFYTYQLSSLQNCAICFSQNHQGLGSWAPTRPERWFSADRSHAPVIFSMGGDRGLRILKDLHVFLSLLKP